MEPLSVFITTFNNADTLRACLASVAWADEVLVLDSYSTDETLAIAREHGCTIHQHPFQGYGRQKQLAMDLTCHERVLLLDADEVLSPALQDALRRMRVSGFDADGYEFPRHEQVFWRMSSPLTRKNYYLRLLRKPAAHITDMPVHAAPRSHGRIERRHEPFYHFGERDIHTKVEKINAYSTGLVADKVARERRPGPWIMVVYPPLFFLRSYLFKRGFVNGWAGFIASLTGAFYVFLKYAKLYEHYRFAEHGDSLMPPGAPRLRPPQELHDRPV